MSVSTPVSIVINTNGRGASLGRTLASLPALDHSPFEVVVVAGPDDEGLEEAVAPFADRVKLVRCPERNLSASRNLGIAAAAGDLVAFIDDDAIPDPGWLGPIVAAFGDPEVAAAGGPVMDHTGGRLQALFSWGTRTGLATGESGAPNAGFVLSSPDSWAFPITLGTNSCFRRERLVAMGGFDEEFDYYHDEADVCLRLVDGGWDVRTLDEGVVHHKFLPSAIRDETRVLRSWRQVMKNLVYFAITHGLPRTSFAEVVEDLAGYVRLARNDLEVNIAAGRVDGTLRDVFESEVAEGFDEGFRRGMEGRPRTRPPEWFDAATPPFLPFPTLRRPEDRLHLVLLTQEYLPGPVNGVARVVHELAVGLAARGHVVRVLTRGEDHLRVDLEQGVWVHRLPPSENPAPADVPAAIWAHADAVADEVARIDAVRAVDVVQFSNWDAEGIAVLRRGLARTSIWPVTTVRALRGSDPRIAADDPVLAALEALEAEALRSADRVMASSPAVIADVRRDYGLRIDPTFVDVVPLGLPEPAPVEELPHEEGTVEILFVGRLEPRKGIDLLLAAAPAVLRRHPAARLTIAGDDGQPGPDGVSYRRAFEATPEGRELAGRVRFLGRVDDARRDALYAWCDVFVAPSRYESFGMVLLEAMRHGTPVIGARVGGMATIIDDGVSGLQITPGDAGALASALERMVASDALRAELGAGAREAFLARYTVERMVDGANRHFDRLLGRGTADARPAPRSVPVPRWG